MKTTWLIAVLIALSGCSTHDSENDLDACEAEGMKAHITQDYQPIFVRACMGGKSYQYVLSKACMDAADHQVNWSFCFERRGLWLDIRNALNK